MTGLIPNRFLFDLEFPLRYRDPLPRVDGTLKDWTPADRLPQLGALDGRPEFAPVWACWSERGLALACEVSGKRSPLRCDPKSYWTGDNLRLCIDMRDARTNRRATRYCRQFFFLPTGGGPDHRSPVAGVGVFSRAREAAPPVSVDRIQVAAKITRSGYALEAVVPVECLVGFDPQEHPRIGLYYLLEDADHGQQYLTVGDDLNWHVDPSTWATAVLIRESD